MRIPAERTRITGNIIHDISTMQAAIFIEASQSPNLVDHNIIWNIDGEGVRVADTDNVTIAHNIFGHVAEELVVAKVATSRSVGGRKLTSIGNRLLNNIVVDQGRPMASADPSNVADYNVYVSTGAQPPSAKDSGDHSVAIHAAVEFDPDRMLLTWKSAEALPPVPLIKGCELDFFYRDRTSGSNVSGPFSGLASPATLQLKRRLQELSCPRPATGIRRFLGRHKRQSTVATRRPAPVSSQTTIWTSPASLSRS